MKIWKIARNTDNFSGCMWVNEEDISKLRENKEMRKNTKITEWEPIEFSHEPNKPISDLGYYWGGAPSMIINQRTKEIFEKEFGDLIQPLEMKSISYPNENYYLLYVLNFKEVLDLEKSEYERNEKLNFITTVKKYVFTEEARNESIFYLTLENVTFKTRVFVNDYFKKVVEENGLTGFVFEEMYDFGDEG